MASVRQAVGPVEGKAHAAIHLPLRACAELGERRGGALPWERRRDGHAGATPCQLALCSCRRPGNHAPRIGEDAGLELCAGADGAVPQAGGRAAVELGKPPQLEARHRAGYRDLTERARAIRAPVEDGAVERAAVQRVDATERRAERGLHGGGRRGAEARKRKRGAEPGLRLGEVGFGRGSPSVPVGTEAVLGGHPGR